jgi:uncharacterized protein
MKKKWALVVYMVACCLVVLSVTPQAAAMTTEPGNSLPAAPLNLTVKSIAADTVKIYWADKSNNETGFAIERREGEGSFAQIATTGADSVWFIDTGLGAGKTYAYRVRAFNEAGYSDYTHIVSTTPLDTTVPAAPANLSAVFKDGAVYLAWTDKSEHEDGFKIERKKGDGVYEFIAAVGTNATSFKDSSLAADTTYTYRVRAYNAAGKSAYSNEATATVPNGAGSHPPAAPQNLTVKQTGPDAVKLFWQDKSANEHGFALERKSGDGSFEKIAKLGKDSVYYLDSGLLANKTYTYRVKAYNEAGYSAYSNTISITLSTETKTTETRPAAPIKLQGEEYAEGVARLSWTDQSANETGFKIERKTEGGSYEVVGGVSANTTSYKDKGLQPETTYYYRVRAYNAAGKSDYSNEIKITTSGTNEEPMAPPEPEKDTDLPESPEEQLQSGQPEKILPPPVFKATAFNNGQILLSWNSTSDQILGFDIERKEAGGEYQLIATVRGEAFSYYDIGLPTGSSYSYRIKGLGESTVSAYSEERTVTVVKPRESVITYVFSSLKNLGAWILRVFGLQK